MVEIKPLTPDEWRLLKEVRIAALGEAPYAFTSRLDDALQRSDEDWVRLSEHYSGDPNSVTFFAFENKSPCGMSACVLEAEEAEMLAVWVDPAHRGKGVGNALIEYALTWSRSRGAKRLKVGVFEDNLNAVAFYRSAGFKDVGLTKPELSSEERTVMLLSMDLQENANRAGG